MPGARVREGEALGVLDDFLGSLVVELLEHRVDVPLHGRSGVLPEVDRPATAVLGVRRVDLREAGARVGAVPLVPAAEVADRRLPRVVVLEQGGAGNRLGVPLLGIQGPIQHRREPLEQGGVLGDVHGGDAEVDILVVLGVCLLPEGAGIGDVLVLGLPVAGRLRELLLGEGPRGERPVDCRVRPPKTLEVLLRNLRPVRGEEHRRADALVREGAVGGVVVGELEVVVRVANAKGLGVRIVRRDLLHHRLVAG